MLRVLIACGGGFSSSHLVNQMNKAVREMEDAEAYEVEFFHNVIYRGENVNEYDIVMCCPHLKASIPEWIEKYDLENVPMYIIPTRMYGLINAKEMLIDAAEVVKRFKENPVNPFHFPGEDNPLLIKRTIAYTNAHK